MSDDEFIRAILASPDDDELRLVYADWLEDQSDPRSDYLRLALALEKLQDRQPLEDQRTRLQRVREMVRLTRRLRELQSLVSPDWAARMHRGAIAHCTVPFAVWEDDDRDGAGSCPAFWQRLRETTASASVR
jgi:uncharacterized protein (TIGR02996 family)